MTGIRWKIEQRMYLITNLLGFAKSAKKVTNPDKLQ